jgi:hypothetical protein
MYAKKQVDKLIIAEEPENTWVFTWYFQDEFVWSEKRIYSSPDEKPDLEEIINHKKECCFIIENVEVVWQ